MSDGRSAGVQARSLVILPLTVEDSGAYTCTFTSAVKTGDTFGPVYVTVVTEVPWGTLAGLVLLVALLGLLGARYRAAQS
ncbi:MAG: immunoglobulin domain-containing protein [Candidatus Hydrogenedentota bacterium]